MSATKDYLFRINHPCTWVKGNGAGLPRLERYSLFKGDRRIDFYPDYKGCIICAGQGKIHVSISKARFIYKMHTLYGWQRFQ